MAGFIFSLGRVQLSLFRFLFVVWVSLKDMCEQEPCSLGPRGLAWGRSKRLSVTARGRLRIPLGLMCS